MCQYYSMWVIEPKQTQVSCQDSLLHLFYDNKSMSYDEKSWTLVTWRRPHKKQESHSYPNLPRKEQSKQNIYWYAKKKEEKKPKRKQTIVQVDDLLVQKLITLITLEEYFPQEFFNRGMVTSTHMVSYHEISKEDESGKDEENAFGAEPSKTKEDDEIHRNPSLYATKIKGAKWFEDKGHDCTTCCANNGDENDVTSNFTTIVFKPRHYSDAP